MRSILKKGLENEINHNRIIDELLKHTKNKNNDSEHIYELAKILESFLGSIPEAIEAVNSFAKDPHCGRYVSFASGNVFQYLFDE